LSTSPHIAELLQTCEAAARAGGRELAAWRGRFQAREKGIADYVTDADLASQAAIRQVIVSRFPDHDFIGEEQPPDSFSSCPDTVHWIVDPLDGTTNYIHDFPCYAVSVAAARGSELLATVIYDPIHEKCFAAAAGQGAWCNGRKLTSSRVTELGEALVAISLPARPDRKSPDLLDFIEATQVCQAVRRTGSAALNLAHVASGALDAFWATHIHPWDVAAGVLLVREAGGIVSARDGGEFNLWRPDFIAAASQQLHGRLLSALTPCQGR
jgi:myo-inositol-1(or 4)-monophosphatase